MGMPIEQAAQVAARTDTSDPYFGVDAKPAAPKPADDQFDIASLVKAQHEFIEALFDYAQTKDVHVLLEAQTTFIQAQALTLHQLGIL